jgi:hypothetical protein
VLFPMLEGLEVSRGLQGVPGSRVRSFKLLFRRENFIHSLRCRCTPPQKANLTPPPPCIRNARAAALTRSAPYALKSLLSQSPIQRPPFHDSTASSPPPIMTVLSRSAATAVSALPAAARGPRLSVACRNPVSAAPSWCSGKIATQHVLLHVAVAAMMASAAFSVARAQGWSTAQLSQARHSLSATSVGTVALFAGGESSMLLMIVFVCCARDR